MSESPIHHVLFIQAKNVLSAVSIPQFALYRKCDCSLVFIAFCKHLLTFRIIIFRKVSQLPIHATSILQNSRLERFKRLRAKTASTITSHSQSLNEKNNQRNVNLSRAISFGKRIAGFLRGMPKHSRWNFSTHGLPLGTAFLARVAHLGKLQQKKEQD